MPTALDGITVGTQVSFAGTVYNVTEFDAPNLLVNNTDEKNTYVVKIFVKLPGDDGSDAGADISNPAIGDNPVAAPGSPDYLPPESGTLEN